VVVGEGNITGGKVGVERQAEGIIGEGEAGEEV